MTLRGIADTLLSLLLAPPCAICDSVLAKPLSGAVCDDCWAAIRSAPASFTLRHISYAQAIGVYDGTLRHVIHVLKYQGRRSVAPRLAAMIRQHAESILSDADVVVPVPLHSSRWRQRGFNQADDLARALGRPVSRALLRTRSTKPQIDLPAAERRTNVRGAFALRPRARADVHNRVVVLVDDVATTGATLEACASVLRAGGARDVRAVTAARAVT